MQQAFLAFAAFYAFLLLFNKEASLQKKIIIPTALFAVFVGLYHGFLLSFVTARPLWSAGASGIVSFASLITTGIAAVLVCASFTEKSRSEVAEIYGITGNILVVSILVQLFAILIWVVSLATGKADFVNAFHVLNSRFGLQFWGIAVCIGLLAPLAILFTKRNKPILIFLTGALILIGGFALRHTIILAGQIS